jgi:hypothetical protein
MTRAEGRTALVSLRASASCFSSHNSAYVLMNHVAVPVRQPLATLCNLFLLLVGSNRNPDDGYFPEEKHDDDAVNRILNGATQGSIRINRFLPFGNLFIFGSNRSQP